MELLAVMTVIALLLALAATVVNQPGSAARMRGAVDMTSSLATLARQKAASENLPTAFVVIGAGGPADAALREMAVFQLRPRTNSEGDANEYEWEQVTRWQSLPKGVAFMPDSFANGRDFFVASPVEDYSSLVSAVERHGQSLSANAMAFQVFLPSGRRDGAEASRTASLRLVRGTVENGALRPTGGVDEEGVPVGAYDINLVPVSGRVKINPAQ